LAGGAKWYTLAPHAIDAREIDVEEEAKRGNQMEDHSECVSQGSPNDGLATAQKHQEEEHKPTTRPKKTIDRNFGDCALFKGCQLSQGTL